MRIASTELVACGKRCAAEDGGPVPREVRLGVHVVGPAWSTGQRGDPVAERFGNAVRRGSADPSGRVDRYPAGFVQAVAAEAASQHRDIEQIVAFALGAYRTTLDMGGNQKLDRVLVPTERARCDLA